MEDGFPWASLICFLLMLLSLGALGGILLTIHFKELPYDKIQHAQEVCSSNEGIKYLTHNKVVCNNSSSFEYKQGK